MQHLLTTLAKTKYQSKLEKHQYRNGTQLEHNTSFRQLVSFFVQASILLHPIWYIFRNSSLFHNGARYGLIAIAHSTLSGIINLAVSVWLYQSGCISLAVSVWLYQSGCISLAVSFWLYQSGCISLAVSVWLYQSSRILHS